MQFLVILRVKPSTTREQLIPLLKAEAAKAWELIAAGAARQVYYIKGGAGAVILMEGNHEKTIEQQVQSLPMVAQGLLSVEIQALEPYTGLANLFAKE